MPTDVDNVEAKGFGVIRDLELDFDFVLDGSALNLRSIDGVERSGLRFGNEWESEVVD